MPFPCLRWLITRGGLWGGCDCLGEEGVSFFYEAQGFLALGVPGVVLGVVVEPVSMAEGVLELSFDFVEGLLEFGWG
ncbi:MAG: hypothetical protein F4088_01300 [Chloroflexi bacterium]|nr:hypothetical protein [Chloroflexota bacterium]